MAYSFFPAPIEDYVANKYSVKRWGAGRNLVTTDHGAWVLIDDRELRLLKAMKVSEDPALFNLLKEKGVIVTEESFSKIADDYAKRFHFLDYGPTLHIVVPTFRCNQKCIYCHSRSQSPDAKGYDMDEATAKRVVDFIMSSPAKSMIMEFQGGDCSMNFGAVKYMVGYATEQAERLDKKLKFSVVTNLTAMNEEMLGFLRESKIMGLSTSLDGPKHVHDANRKYIDGTGTYDQVAYWVKRIKSEFKYDFNLNAMTTITRHSLPYAKEIVDEFVELGFTSVWLRFLNNLGFAHGVWNEISYTPEEFLKFWREGLNRVLEANHDRVFQENFSKILLMKMLSKKDPMFVDIQSPCGAGIGQLLYDNSGDIFTCDEAKVLGDTFRLGNVKDTKFSQAINHPTISSMLNISSKLCGTCDACAYSPYCGICPVDSYMSQGSIVPKLAESFRCKVLKGMIDTLFQEMLFSERSRKVFFSWFRKPL